MTGGTCHKHDNYTTIHLSNGCKVLTNQNAENRTSIQSYIHTYMQPYSYRTYVRLLRLRAEMPSLWTTVHPFSYVWMYGFNQSQCRKLYSQSGHKTIQTFSSPWLYSFLLCDWLKPYIHKTIQTFWPPWL